uniref:hypothetical protein n=1 Tax=Actinoplanes sp. CA-151224 TaxID=3239904 RepID=UPI003F495297
MTAWETVVASLGRGGRMKQSGQPQQDEVTVDLTRTERPTARAFLPELGIFDAPSRGSMAEPR